MENEQLVFRIKAGESTSDNMLLLWRRNTGLIDKIANMYKHYAKFEDLQQEGYIGLCQAVEHYDCSADVKFSTYAFFRIQQAVSRCIKNCDSCVRVPIHIRNKISEYKRIFAKYKQYSKASYAAFYVSARKSRAGLRKRR